MATVNMGIDFDIDAIRKRVQKHYATAQNAFTAEAKHYGDVFIPMQSGNLQKDVEYIKKNGVNVGWQYHLVYARAQYYGVSKKGNAFIYSKDLNPNARNRWVEHGAAVYGDEILQAITEAINNGDL